MGEEESQLLTLNMITRWPRFGRLELMVLWGARFLSVHSLHSCAQPGRGNCLQSEPEPSLHPRALSLWPWGLGAFDALRVSEPGAGLSFTKHSFYCEESSTVSGICLLSRSLFFFFLLFWVLAQV